LIKKYTIEDCNSYGDESIQNLLLRYGKERPAEYVMGEKFTMPALVNLIY